MKKKEWGWSGGQKGGAKAENTDFIQEQEEEKGKTKGEKRKRKTEREKTSQKKLE